MKYKVYDMLTKSEIQNMESKEYHIEPFQTTEGLRWIINDAVINYISGNRWFLIKNQIKDDITSYDSDFSYNTAIFYTEEKSDVAYEILYMFDRFFMSLGYWGYMIALKYQKNLLNTLDDLNFCEIKAFRDYKNWKEQVLKGKATDKDFIKWLENMANYYSPKNPEYARYLRSLLA